MNGIGSHQSADWKKDEWLTPRWILNRLGEFDLDPCAPINRPWDTAKRHFTIYDNGLMKDWGWKQRIWCFIGRDNGLNCNF